MPYLPGLLGGPVGGSASPAGLDEPGALSGGSGAVGVWGPVVSEHEALAGNRPELADSGLLISWHSDSRQPGSQRRP